MKSLAFIILSGLAFVAASGNDTTVMTLDTLTLVHPTPPAFARPEGPSHTAETLNAMTWVRPTSSLVRPGCPRPPRFSTPNANGEDPAIAAVTDVIVRPGCPKFPTRPVYHPSMAAVTDVVKPECSKIPGYHPGMAVVTDKFGCPTIPRLPTRSVYRLSVAVVTDVTAKPGCSKLPTRPVYHPGMAAVTDKPGCTTRPKLPVYHPSIAAFTDATVKPECSKIPGYHPGMAVVTDKFGCPTIPRLPTRSIYHPAVAVGADAIVRTPCPSSSKLPTPPTNGQFPTVTVGADAVVRPECPRTSKLPVYPTYRPADISFSTPDVAQPTGHPDAKTIYVCSTSTTSPLFSDAIKAAGLAAENISTEDNQGCKEVSASGTAAIGVCTGLGRLVQHGHFKALIEKCKLEIDGVLRVGGSVRLDGGGGKAVAVVYRRS